MLTYACSRASSSSSSLVLGGGAAAGGGATMVLRRLRWWWSFCLGGAPASALAAASAAAFFSTSSAALRSASSFAAASATASAAAASGEPGLGGCSGGGTHGLLLNGSSGQKVTSMITVPALLASSFVSDLTTPSVAALAATVRPRVTILAAGAAGGEMPLGGLGKRQNRRPASLPLRGARTALRQARPGAAAAAVLAAASDLAAVAQLHRPAHEPASPWLEGVPGPQRPRANLLVVAVLRGRGRRGARGGRRVLSGDRVGDFGRLSLGTSAFALGAPCWRPRDPRGCPGWRDPPPEE